MLHHRPLSTSGATEPGEWGKRKDLVGENQMTSYLTYLKGNLMIFISSPVSQ